MAQGSAVDGTINSGGTNSGRKTIATHGGGRLRIVQFKVTWPAISNNTTAAITYQVIVGFTNWASGDNQEHVLETITLPKNSTRNAGNKTYSGLSYMGRPSRDMYGRITVTSPSGGSSAIANKAFTFQALEYYQYTKPSVTAGTTITDTQMDNLRAWMAFSPNDIADQAQVKASDGNTYRTGLTAGSTTVAASWYNAAADSVT